MTYTNNAHVQLLPQPCAADNIADAITHSRHSLWLMIYQTTAASDRRRGPAQHITDAIINAASRGVQVKALLARHDDNDPRARDNRAFATAIEHYGAKTRTIPSQSLMHAKLIMIDDYITFHLTSNLTNAAFNRNVEVNIFVASHLHAGRVRTRFDELWRGLATPTHQTAML